MHEAGACELAFLARWPRAALTRDLGDPSHPPDTVSSPDCLDSDGTYLVSAVKAHQSVAAAARPEGNLVTYYRYVLFSYM